MYMERQTIFFVKAFLPPFHHPPNLLLAPPSEARWGYTKSLRVEYVHLRRLNDHFWSKAIAQLLPFDKGYRKNVICRDDQLEETNKLSLSVYFAQILLCPNIYKTFW